MRFLTMVKGSETAGPPPAELMDAIGKFTEEQAKAGVLRQTGGLMPSAAGAKVRLSGGRLSVIDGPFTETKELVGGYAILELGSREEAIDACTRIMELHKELWPGWDGEVEIRQLMDDQEFS